MCISNLNFALKMLCEACECFQLCDAQPAPADELRWAVVDGRSWCVLTCWLPDETCKKPEKFSCNSLKNIYFHFSLAFFFSADKTPAGFPTIVQGPVTRVIEIGHTAVLQCKATGNPQPKILWYRDMKRVDMQNPRYALLDGKCRGGSLQWRNWWVLTPLKLKKNHLERRLLLLDPYFALSLRPCLGDRAKFRL